MHKVHRRIHNSDPWQHRDLDTGRDRYPLLFTVSKSASGFKRGWDPSTLFFETKAGMNLLQGTYHTSCSKRDGA